MFCADHTNSDGNHFVKTHLDRDYEEEGKEQTRARNWDTPSTSDTWEHRLDAGQEGREEVEEDDKAESEEEAEEQG